MNISDGEPNSAPHKSRSKFWFGTSLAQFLKAELTDFPGRRIAATRLFVVSLIIALVSQTLHIPPLGAIALLICLSYDAYANVGQSLAFGLRQLGYLIVTTLVSVFTLMFAGNNAWLMLTLSFIILTIALFHARLIAWPTGIALWYSVAVLYTPSMPDENIYLALWNIPIIGVLALGSWTMVHLIIKPQDPRKQLKASIAAELAAVEHIFSTRLADSGIHSHRPVVLSKHSDAGSFGKILALLSNAELIYPAMRNQHDTYLALLLEIDGLRQLAIWLNQVLATEYRAQPMNSEKINVYLALQDACATLQQGVEESCDVSEQISLLLTEDVLYSYSQQSNPSVLTALWSALQRIAGLMHQLHQPATKQQNISIDSETDSSVAENWFPAWFGYEFWATHADSLQFGIKFSLGAILCMLIVQGLDWPDINTAIPTCLVAAQTSLGADYRLSILRLSGATLGGVCAYFYVMVFQPQLDTIVGFAFATAPFWAIAAWITAGSERIAYMGRQLGFSFALFVLHDFGAVTDLYLSRDRVIGILLGLIVMAVLDYALWPRRSVVLARHHSVSALRSLAKFTTRLPDLSYMLNYILPLRLSAEKDLAAGHDLLAHAVLEPDARLIAKVHERTALRTVIRDTSSLSALLQVRKRYRLLSGQQFSSFPDELQQHSHAFDTSLATALEYAALTLEGEQQKTWNQPADIHARLKQSYIEHHRIANLPADLAKEWEIRFMLDQQIMDLVENIQKNAQDLNPVSAGNGRSQKSVNSIE
ncbi:fusaric acid resistance protein [Methyloprofundus sedimenti]|uniref:Fusaric acid resistance protein n=1 Tax=Methyloprofundus sedimenti TaxID=1420851 RepID=A0A1V8M1Z8_9GAMM|nr:FUSC family protein [Methyloprofundus sedimenti]OQK15584.1 fusaric acid resistance protein [Methyloprofundus sedimenti]